MENPDFYLHLAVISHDQKIDIEKVFDKIKGLFMIKSHRKLGIEETFLNFHEAYVQKPRDNVMFNGERLSAFSRRWEQGTMLIQHHTGCSSQCNTARKGNKKHTAQKETSKSNSVYK